MDDPRRYIPAYLTEKGNIVRTILLTAAFALVFINIYAPFEVETRLKVTRWGLLAYSSLVILAGVLVVVISRIAMYYTAKRLRLLLWQYLLWVLAEVFFMALFYALFQKFHFNDPRFLPDILSASIRHTALVLLLPYSVLWLYFSWREKHLQLLKLADSPAPAPEGPKQLIPFHDERGELRFSVKVNHLIYIESADNYVNIHYLDKERVQRFTLRNTLKGLEGLLPGGEVIRCHRSYMVNFDKVKILRRERDEVWLELDAPGSIRLPVSKTYAQSVMEVFMRYAGRE